MTTSVNKGVTTTYQLYIALFPYPSMSLIPDNNMYYIHLYNEEDLVQTASSYEVLYPIMEGLRGFIQQIEAS